MSHKSRHIKGDHLMVCDRNGKVYRRSEMRKEWNGLWVHKSEFEV